MNSGGETSLTSKSQVGAGSQVRTGDNSIVSFEYPDQGGVVVFGGNTEVRWVGLESHPAPDVPVSFTTIPQDVEHTFDWGEEGMELLKWTLAGAGAEMILTGAVNPYLLAGEVAVHGGIILVHYGQFYIKENGWPQMFQIPQGFLQGKSTEYAVTVTNSSSVIQVIEGPVVFLDPITSNSITLNSGQQLTLPAPQENGFSQQSLQSGSSVFNSASTDQWWTAATSNSPISFLTDNSAVLAAIIVLIVVVIIVAAVGTSKRKKRQLAQPGFTQPSPIYPDNSKVRSKLIVQSIIALFAFIIVGYVLITVLSYIIGPDEEFVAGISMLTLLEFTIIFAMTIGYIASIVQLIRLFRPQQSNISTPPPVPTGNMQASTNKMLSAPPPAQPAPPAKMFCPNCGNKLASSRNFCPYCGFQLILQDYKSSDSQK